LNAITYATAQIVRVLPRTRITRAAGHLADYAWPDLLGKAVVHFYCRAYNVKLDECCKRDGYTSFDDFFTRELREGARTLPSDPRIVISPADGRIDSLGRVDGHRFEVKGRPYEVSELVGDSAEAKRYEGGSGCVVYLSPRDYHRVHSPVAGKIVAVRSMRGDYYPVNAIGIQHVPKLLVRNRRVAIVIDSQGFGLVTVVMVSAMVVGRITVTGIDARDVPIGCHTLKPPRAIARGEQIGIFHLGSTAVVFFEPGAKVRFLAGVGPIRFAEPLAIQDVQDAIQEATQNAIQEKKGAE